MITLSTHVLDTSLGRPADGIHVSLEYNGAVIGTGLTDADGRVRDIHESATQLGEGNYSLTFSVAEYFSKAGRESFYSEIVVSFQITGSSGHYHVPLLLSPFAYSTYRGS